MMARPSFFLGETASNAAPAAVSQEDSVLQGNSAAVNGGGILNSESNSTLQNVTFESNGS